MQEMSSLPFCRRHKGGTDARVPNDHRPCAASQALLPPALRETDLCFFGVQKKDWNAAYDSLETENAELVLSAVFRANPGVAPDTKISAELHGSTRRQIQINPAPSRTVRCPTELVGEHQRHLG